MRNFILNKFKKINKLILLEWFSSMLLVFGTLLTAFDITPENKYVFLFGNSCFILLSYLWRKKSMLFLSIVLQIIYVAGLYYK